MAHDGMSDLGAQEHFRGSKAFEAVKAEGVDLGTEFRSAGAGSSGRDARPIVVGEDSVGAGWGHGPRPTDSRKFRYDTNRALTSPAVQFTATKADRLDADEAGDILHSIHVKLGIANEDEARLAAFDAALWWQHTINGASILQDARGSLSVGGMEFDIAACLAMIGEHRLRRFFRAYADEILEVNRSVLAEYSPYDAVAAEKHGQLLQIAAARGLHKYPELAFDAADACNGIGLDARRALLASKALVIPDVNATDRPFARGQSTIRVSDALGAV